MFWRRNRIPIEHENSLLSCEAVYAPSFEVDLTVDEYHAYNCLIYSNKGAENKLRELFASDLTINVEQAHYAAWLIDSKKYTGISDSVAKSLRDKLEDFF